jgi:bacteriorhodopsin
MSAYCSSSYSRYIKPWLLAVPLLFAQLCLTAKRVINELPVMVSYGAIRRYTLRSLVQTIFDFRLLLFCGYKLCFSPLSFPLINLNEILVLRQF